MTTSVQRESATIHQFPARGRFAAASQHDEITPAANSASPRVVVGSGWYHDEAIQDDRARRN